MARIRKRGERYSVEIRYKGITDSASFRKLRDAERWARRVESEIDLGTYVPRREQKRRAAEAAARAAMMPTLGELMESYGKAETDKKRGASQEWRRIRWFKRLDIAKKPADKITADDVHEHIERRLEDGASPNTVRLELALLSATYKWAASRRRGTQRLDIQNPVRDVERPAPGRARERRVHPDEEKSLFEAFKQERSFPHICEAYVLAVETAMRRGELCALRWQHVDFEKRVIRLPAELTKTNVARTIPLSERAIAALSRFPQDRDSVLAVSPRRLSDAWQRCCRRAAITDLRWHDLRHEATSRLFERTDLRDLEIMMITGHKSPQMLARYAHLRAGKFVDKLA